MTLEESGLEEPISAYYFKHGTAGLADVYLVGIKETPSAMFSLPGEDLIGIGRQGEREMVFRRELLMRGGLVGRNAHDHGGDHGL